MINNLIWFSLLSFLFNIFRIEKNRAELFFVCSVLFFLIAGKDQALTVYVCLGIVAGLVAKILPLIRNKIFYSFIPLMFSAFFIIWSRFDKNVAVLGFSYIVLGVAADLHVSQKFAFINARRISDQWFNLLSFPRILVGPIVSLVHLEEPDRLRGLKRILLGIFKSLGLLSFFRFYVSTPQIADAAMSGQGVLSFLKLGLWHYLDLYLEFSGAIDLVVGIFNLWGFRISENFDKPYLSTSITDFWRRWHMTLGGWIKSFIYIPLGGNRMGLVRQVGAISIAMSLCGLWHGFTVNFFAWGLLQGLGLAIEKVFKAKLPQYRIKNTIVCWILTQLFVTASWVVFFAYK